MENSCFVFPVVKFLWSNLASLTMFWSFSLHCVEELNMLKSVFQQGENGNLIHCDTSTTVCELLHERRHARISSSSIHFFFLLKLRFYGRSLVYTFWFSKVGSPRSTASRSMIDALVIYAPNFDCYAAKPANYFSIPGKRFFFEIWQRFVPNVTTKKFKRDSCVEKSYFLWFGWSTTSLTSDHHTKERLGHNWNQNQRAKANERPYWKASKSLLRMNGVTPANLPIT